MAGLLDSVLGTLMNDEVTDKMANSLGMEKSQAQSALASAVPILMQAMRRNASTPEGESSLQNALQKDHSGNLLENISGYLDNPKTSEGSKILDHILGNKRANVEKYVSNDSGLSSGMVGSLLSTAAPILMGALAGKQSSSNSGIGSILSGLTGEMQGSSSSKEQSIIEQLLDQDNDGSIIDDVANLGMSFLGKMFKK